jgi:hypothetical protein
MNDCTQSKDGNLEERSDKGLVEEPIGQDPGQERTPGQSRKKRARLPRQQEILPVGLRKIITKFTEPAR